MSPFPSLSTRIMWYATVGMIVSIIAAGALAGHVLRVSFLTDLTGSVPMAINTALCLLLSGAAWITHALDLRYADKPSDTHG